MNITFDELELTWKIYIIIVSFIIGSIMGSFLNCIAYRIVHNESISKGRSHCDICDHKLRFFDLIPIFSYLINKGRCKYCRSKLGVEYLLSELIGGLSFAVIFLRYGLTLKALEYIILVCCLMGASFTDIKNCVIPDRFVIIGICNRILFITLGPNVLLNIQRSFIPAILIGVFLTLLVLIMQKILKKEVMGFGDIKLIFMLSLYGSLAFDIVCIFLSSLIGLIYGIVVRKNKKGSLFPFGQCISLGFFILLIVGEPIVNLILSILVK